MKRIIISAILMLAMSNYAQAQLNKIALNVGYEHIHKSIGYLGGEYRFNNNDLKNNQNSGKKDQLFRRNRNKIE